MNKLTSASDDDSWITDLATSLVDAQPNVGLHKVSVAGSIKDELRDSEMCREFTISNFVEGDMKLLFQIDLSKF